MNEFPDTCLRGLRKEKFVSHGYIVSLAFEPDRRTSDAREDKGTETSINWEDNDEVLDFTLKNRQVAGYGVARVDRETIDWINSNPNSLNVLVYERCPQDNNPYHGNIVFKANIPKALERNICGTLALRSTFISSSR